MRGDDMIDRDLLFVPGDQQHRVDRALRSEADAVVIDLEDGVSSAAKSTARRSAVEVARARTRRVFIRINSPLTPEGQADLIALQDASADALMVPKASVAALGALATTPHEVIALIESALGLKEVAQVAADPRVVRLALGSADLALDVGLPPDADTRLIDHARMQLVLASAATRLPGPVDGVYLQIEDQDGLRRAVNSARTIGMAGMLCIHPTQLQTVAHGFTPTAKDVAQARRIIDAWRANQPSGQGAIRVDDTMVDLPVARRAERLLRQAARGVARELVGTEAHSLGGAETPPNLTEETQRPPTCRVSSRPSPDPT